MSNGGVTCDAWPNAHLLPDGIQTLQLKESLPLGSRESLVVGCAVIGSVRSDVDDTMAHGHSLTSTCRGREVVNVCRCDGSKVTCWHISQLGCRLNGAPVEGIGGLWQPQKSYHSNKQQCVCVVHG